MLDLLLSCVMALPIVLEPFYLHCRIKWQFSPIPPDHGLFDPSHLTGESIWNSEPDAL